MKRREARAGIFKVLFMIDTGENDPDAAGNYILQESGAKTIEETFFHAALRGIMAKRPDLDRLIEEQLINWKLDRLSPVVRNILRLGVYELLFMDDIPEKVSINEAIELAKLYQDEEAGRFVNGILDRVRKDVQKEA